MQTYLPQPLTAREGYIVPPLVAEAGAEPDFRRAMATVATVYEELLAVSQPVAAHVVTHAHLRRLLASLNLRECYHLLKLRTAEQAHFTIREVAGQMLEHLQRVHPLLLQRIHLRDTGE